MTLPKYSTFEEFAKGIEKRDKKYYETVRKAVTTKKHADKICSQKPH